MEGVIILLWCRTAKLQTQVFIYHFQLFTSGHKIWITSERAKLWTRQMVLHVHITWICKGLGLPNIFADPTHTGHKMCRLLPSFKHVGILDKDNKSMEMGGQTSEKPRIKPNIHQNQPYIQTFSLSTSFRKLCSVSRVVRVSTNVCF